MDVDFYTMKYFDNKFNTKNFFEIQRLAYPFFERELPSDNNIVYTLLSNYTDRLDEVDDDSIEKLIDTFLNTGSKYIMNDKSIENALRNISYNNLIYLNDLIEVSIFEGKYSKVSKKVKYNYYGSDFETDIITEDGLPYAHFEYDNILKDFLKMINLEINFRFARAILFKYDYYNLHDFSYDDFVNLMTSIVIKSNSVQEQNSDYSRLFKAVSNILDIYNYYSLDLHIENIDLRKLSKEKLNEINSAIDIALQLLQYGDNDLAFSSFMLIRNSDVVIDIQRLDEAISICENNDLNTIKNFKNSITNEIINRRDNAFSFKDFDLINDDKKETTDFKKIKK